MLHSSRLMPKLQFPRHVDHPIVWLQPTVFRKQLRRCHYRSEAWILHTYQWIHWMLNENAKEFYNLHNTRFCKSIIEKLTFQALSQTFDKEHSETLQCQEEYNLHREIRILLCRCTRLLYSQSFLHTFFFSLSINWIKIEINEKSKVLTI